MKKSIVCFWLLVLLFTLSGSTLAQDDRVTLTLINDFDTPNCTVAARMAGADEWKQAEIPIAPGVQYEIAVLHRCLCSSGV
jgi:hypothetical protein